MMQLRALDTRLMTLNAGNLQRKQICCSTIFEPQRVQNPTRLPPRLISRQNAGASAKSRPSAF
jgi:hypothetical protein